MMRLGRSLAVLALATAACAVDVPPPPSVPATSSPTTTTTSTPPTSTSQLNPTTSQASTATCMMGDIPFAEDGLIATFGVEGGGDASSLAGFRWSADEMCERFVIDLATTGGSPAATLGRTSVELRASSGLIRIVLPEEVQSTSIADSLVDTPLIGQAFVVRQVDDRLHVDLHLDSPTSVMARAFAANSPARIVIDLVPTEDDMPTTPPDQAAGLVLIVPEPGPSTYPLRVSGYARFAGQVQAVLGPETPARVAQTATVAGSGDAWGAFSLIFGAGPTGTVELFVGEDVGGALSGLSVLLDLR